MVLIEELVLVLIEKVGAQGFQVEGRFCSSQGPIIDRIVLEKQNFKKGFADGNVSSEKDRNSLMLRLSVCVFAGVGTGHPACKFRKH